jgi:uncharacterized coiled-coil protein SlyX
MVIEDHANCDETIAELKQTIAELEQLVLFLRKRIRSLNKQLELEQIDSTRLFAKWAALRMGSRNQDETSGRR